MHCLRHILLYSILIPMSAASPFFLLIFSIAAYWAIQPCGYCMTILAILFFSTSPSSPFLAVLSNPPPAPPVPSTPVAYDTNIPDRGAFFLNGGQIFDPVLVGYREMQRVWRETLEGEQKEGSSNSAVSQSPQSTEQDPLEPSANGSGATLLPEPASTAPTHTTNDGLPAGYVDLRIGGVGLVLDLGWRRTDEGLHWEVDNVRQVAEAKRSRRATRERRRAGHQHQPVPPVAAAAAADKGENPWLRTPFVGLW